MRLPVRALAWCASLTLTAGLVVASTPAEAGQGKPDVAALCPPVVAKVPGAKPKSGPLSAARPASKPARASVDASKLMILGDSITHGSTGDWTWRYRLWKHLVASGVGIDFVGPADDLENIVTTQHGDRDHAYLDPSFDQDHGAQYGRPYYEEAHLIHDKVAQHRPDYLLVALGISDLGWFRLTPAEVEMSARAVVANSRRAKPNVQIVLGKVLPNFLALEDAAFAATLADFNRRLEDVAAELTTEGSPVVVADATGEFAPGEHTWDGTHANARGELRIAAAFADALATKLGVGTPYPRPYPEVPVGPQEPPVATVTPAGPSRAVLAWKPSLGATEYWVWMKDGVQFSQWIRLPDPLTPQSNPWHIIWLVPGRTYTYKLQAAKGNLGAFSNEVSLVVPGAEAPVHVCRP